MFMRLTSLWMKRLGRDLVGMVGRRRPACAMWYKMVA